MMWIIENPVAVLGLGIVVICLLCAGVYNLWTEEEHE